MVFRWNSAVARPQIGLQPPHVGGGGGDGGLGRGNLLRPRAGLEIGQARGPPSPSPPCAAAISSAREPASSSASAASAVCTSAWRRCHVALQVGRIERGHHLALLDHLAFVEEPLLDAAGDLEGHLGLGRLDVARDANAARFVIMAQHELPDTSTRPPAASSKITAISRRLMMTQ